MAEVKALEKNPNWQVRSHERKNKFLGELI